MNSDRMEAIARIVQREREHQAARACERWYMMVYYATYVHIYCMLLLLRLRCVVHGTRLSLLYTNMGPV